MRSDWLQLDGSGWYVREKYQQLAESGLDVSVQDLAYLYSAYASDKVKGTSEASNFRDAVRQHRLIDEIHRKSAAFFEKVSVNA